MDQDTAAKLERQRRDDRVRAAVQLRERLGLGPYCYPARNVALDVVADPGARPAALVIQLDRLDEALMQDIGAYSHAAAAVDAAREVIRTDPRIDPQSDRTVSTLRRAVATEAEALEQMVADLEDTGVSALRALIVARLRAAGVVPSIATEAGGWRGLRCCRHLATLIRGAREMQRCVSRGRCAPGVPELLAAQRAELAAAGVPGL